MKRKEDSEGLGSRLRAAGLSPRKVLGQHFLLDPRILASIVSAADIGAQDRVFEVGTGAGTLTRELGTRAAEVLSVEIDPEMLAFARRELAGLPQVRFLCADVLKGGSDLSLVVREALESMQPFAWVSNLPYQVASTLLVAICESGLHWTRAALTVQAEVAERVAATAGGHGYGPLSALVAYWAQARGGRHIPPGAFWPPPRVQSRVLLLERCEPLGEPQEYPQYRSWVKRLFAQRRKQLQGLLREALGAAGAAKVLHETGWDPKRRPESLEPREFLRLARLWPRAPAPLGENPRRARRGGPSRRAR